MMTSVKLTKKDIERVLPPMDKERAIEQTEKYVSEYEKSKKELEEILKKLKELYNEDQFFTNYQYAKVYCIYYYDVKMTISQNKIES